MKILKCSLCGTESLEDQIKDSAAINSNVRFFKDHVFLVWRCPACKSLHSDSNVDLGHYYDHYPLKNQKADFIMKCSFANRLRMMLKYGLRKDSTILDFGCGNGLFVDYLSERGFKSVFGYDPFVPKYSSEVVLDRTYDFVTSYDVIEHVDEPLEYLRKLLEIISPEGILIIGTPNATNISLSRTADYMLELHQPYHRHILSAEILQRLAFEFGLKLLFRTDRFYLDTLVPFVNTRFAWEYIKARGNFLDSVVEKIDFLTLLKKPILFFYGYLGYFFPVTSNMTLIFKLAHKNRQNLNYRSQHFKTAVNA